MTQEEKDLKKKEDDAKAAAVLNSGEGATTTNLNPAPVIKDKDKKDEFVQIKRSDFDRMMGQMEKQSKDIELLYKTADKSRLAKEMDKDGENLVKQAKVSVWEDTNDFIVGWKLITNKCEVIMGKWIEEQTVNVIFDNGKTMTVPLLEFYRRTLKKVPADIISRDEKSDEITKKKSTIFKLQFDNGKTLLIDSTFVN